MLKNTKTNESGRSMVEMLGVLAIIGVLSVAGIAGYSTAMKRYKANELLNEASKRAVVVAGKFLHSNTADLSEFAGQTVAGGSFVDNTPITKDGNNQFTLTINGVDEDVCNQMEKSLPAAVQKFDASCATSNTVKLTFNADLRQGPVTTSNDDIKVDDGFRTGCKSNSDCGECGECDERGECWRTLDGENCLACSDGEMTYIYEEEPPLCFSCNSLNGFLAEEVPSCETECGGERIVSDGWCMLKNCPSGWNRAEDGSCIQANLEGCAYFSSSATECTSCSDTAIYSCSNDNCISECKKCNRVLMQNGTGTYCMATCPNGTRLNSTTRICEEVED